MSGRRQYHRYGVEDAGGSLRVLRDVIVRRGTATEFVVITDDAMAIGELLTLERLIGGALIANEVAVVDSRPVMVNGSMRHRVRLRATAPATDGKRQRARRAQ